MTVLITVSIPQGSFAGPFNLLSNADGYDVPFALNISANDLLDGFLATNVLDGSTIIRVQSIDGCTTYYDALISLPSFCDSNIIIGSQLWMACNLNVDSYTDGTAIPEVQDSQLWETLTTGAWCYHNNDPESEATYGKLYNWYAVKGIWTQESNPPTLAQKAARKKLAPDGWHIPSETEINSLIDYSGGLPVASSRLRETSDLHWAFPNTDATNLNNFTALGGGERTQSGNWLPIKETAKFWTSYENTNYFTSSFSKTLYLQENYLAAAVNAEYIKAGVSVRCINDAVQPPNCSDVKIGDQTWTRCNLDVDRFRDGTLIEQATTHSQWLAANQAGRPAWCWNNFSAANGLVYGKLYNGYAVQSIRELAPLGYHIPTFEEYETLANYLGGYPEAAPFLRESGTVHWETNGGAPGVPTATNSSGFTALGAGAHDGSFSFTNVKTNAYFWTSTPGTPGTDNLKYRWINDDSSYFGFSEWLPSSGYSLRLIKDSI